MTQEVITEMKRAFLFLAFSFALAQSSFALQGGEAVDPRASIAATAISLGDLSSGSLTRSYCSGVIVAAHTVITAAHCLAGKNASQVLVLFGFDGQATSVMRLGTEIHLPNEYRSYGDALPNARDNFDIGVLNFEGDLPAGFQPAQLQLTELGDQDLGSRFTTAGFGLPNRGTLTSCEVNLLNAGFSRSEFELSASPACSPATGDSGGPVYRASDTGIQLYGLHNWGWHDAAGNPSMSVEVKISFYGPWIRSLSR